MAVEEIKKSRRINAPAQKVSLLIEDADSIPKWNPLIRKINRKEKLHGPGSELEWEAAVADTHEAAKTAGVPVPGSSKVTKWERGKEYAWSSTDSFGGVTYQGRFVLEPEGDKTVLTAILSYDIPNKAMGLLNHAGFKQLLGGAVEKALTNIENLVTKS